jgi:hypothetical protein
VIFENTHLKTTLAKLISSYKEQFKIISDQSMADVEKQKSLMKLGKEQLLGLGKLLISLVLLISPFLSFFFLQYLHPSLSPDLLLTFWGIIIPLVTVVVYAQIKKHYGHLFRLR